jgi:radical SAM protein with 4Fe4S-binding SPASM domain
MSIVNTIYKPLWVVLELTEKCNFRCRHCSTGDGTHLSDEVDLEKWQEVIDMLADEGCYHITLSGGEPLLRDDVFEIVAHCKRRNIRTALASNGSLLSPDNVYQLKSVGIDYLQLSLDGLKEEHEAMRGPNTFSMFLAAAAELRRQEVRFGTMTVITKQNYDKLDDVVCFSYNQGARYIAFERFTPVGRGAENRQLLLDSDSVRKSFEKLWSLGTEYPIKINDPLRVMLDPDLQRLAEKETTVCGGCLVGIATCTIGANLDLKLCPRLEYSLGNLKKDAFRKLWDEDCVVKRLRSRQISSKCTQCSYIYVCGGCRAEAFANTGDMFNGDPGCWLE